ncbi:MAG: ice-binding family protein [Gallionella sp.]|nr:ice-binding family protein [Gallionella sp.]MDD4960193.1 ice-binding family protein [Gallionella sp.]
MNRLASITKPLLWLMALLMTTFVTGCGGGGSGSPILGLPNIATMVSLAVTPAAVSIPITGTQQYRAIASYSDGSSRDVTAASTWTSGTLGVATIAPTTGFATGLSGGTSLITATYTAGAVVKSASTNLTVNVATSVSFKLTPTTATIPVSGTQQFAAIETFSDGSSFDRTTTSIWTSGSANATVLNTGIATGVTTSIVPVVITATYTVGAVVKVATAALTVNAATSVSFNITPTTASIPVTGNQQYTAIETFSDGTRFDRTAATVWSSNNANATIALGTSIATGITANAVPVVITATYTVGAVIKTATAALTVTAATSKSFVVTPAATTVSVAGTQQYTAIETFSDGTTQDRTALSLWTSGSANATVLNTGVATGVTANAVPVVITATYTVGAVVKTATASLTVTAATSVSFKVTPATASIPVTGNQQYTAIETFSDGTQFDRTASTLWTSGSANATIAAGTSIATGITATVLPAVITATYTVGAVVKTATAALTVTAATSKSFAITPVLASIPVTGIQHYTAIETFSDGTTQDRTALTVWTSGSANATVLAGSNIATGITANVLPVVITGTYTVGAVVKTATAALTVTSATSKSFAVTPATTTISVSGTQKYTAIETFSDGTTQDRTALSVWTSGSPNATIAAGTSVATGVTVTAVPAVITATYTVGAVVKTATGALTVTAATSVSFVVAPATASIPVTGNQQYTAIETFSDGSSFDRTASSTWTSGSVNATIAAGTSVATGITTTLVPVVITATYTVGAVVKTATANLTVNAATSKSFAVTPALASIPVTGNQYYTAIETFSDGTTQDRTALTVWTSGSANATVLAGSNVATGITASVIPVVITGTYTVGAVVKTATANLNVTAATSKSFAVAPALASIPVGGSLQYTAIETFTDGSTQDRTALSVWTSGSVNATIAAGTSVATGVTVTAAPVVITATYTVGAVVKTATSALTVTAAPSRSFVVTPIAASITVGATQQFTAIETFTDGSTIDRTAASIWTSANGNATVLNTGVATGVTATVLPVVITATYTVGAVVKTATANLTVTAVPPAGCIGSCPAPVLGTIAPFGFYSGASLTNQGDLSVIFGDVGIVGAAASITGLHDALGRSYTETCPSFPGAVGCGLVTGTIFANNAPVGGPFLGPLVASDALTAFNDMGARAGGLAVEVAANNLVIAGAPTAGELGGRTLAPGTYKSTPGTYAITAGNLTLDAGGNPNAVWVFQTAAGTGTLTVSTPAGPLATSANKVLLINGALAKNVFWYVPAGAVINTGSNMVGTMIGNAAITFGTATGANPVIVTVLNGRAISLVAGATMVNTMITVPAP